MNKIYQDENYSLLLTDSGMNRCLFNQPDFINFQNQVFKSRTLVFTLYKRDNNQPIACLDFSHKGENTHWYTPVIGAFSHLEAVKSLSFIEMELLITQAAHYLAAQEHMETLSWRIPPLYFNSEITHKLYNTLFRLGWKQNACELNFHIPLCPAGSFREGLGKTKRNELNRLARTETSFNITSTPQDIAAIYQVISENHQARGYPMTMSLTALLELKNALPEALFFANLVRGETLLAGAIVLRLDRSSLYIFNWGESPAFRQESPITQLCEHLYQHAADHNYRYLDIGISTENSVPNQGLVNFKINIGCEISHKFVMTYQSNSSQNHEC
ncbi:GNAT family N-acetyltransferase [Buttiauxella sp.]|uniref:GNAT family N-acetyltransferase n=1 Tax=Buttiauxella sp. TaxID=1972222 RepID=UPI003C7733DF